MIKVVAERFSLLNVILFVCEYIKFESFFSQLIIISYKAHTLYMFGYFRETHMAKKGKPLSVLQSILMQWCSVKTPIPATESVAFGY